jgi:hypothetical protein
MLSPLPTDLQKASGDVGEFKTVLENEKDAWAKDHKLETDEELQKQQIRLLENFRSKELHLCWRRMAKAGIKYRHVFILDPNTNWCIEFGGGGFNNCAVLVHNHPQNRESTYVRKIFRNTRQVRERMEKVCGARGYSIMLRNCEHVATYISTGSWSSLQTTKKGIFFTTFKNHLMGNATKKTNCLPQGLKPELKVVPMWVDEKEGNARDSLLRFERELEFVGTVIPESQVNIVVVGPTGCGKSHLISALHNRTCCPAAESVHAVGRNVHIIRSTGYSYPGRKFRTINVFDCIGFCDTVLSASEVLSLVKDKIKINATHVHHVIVVNANRLPRQSQLAIQSFMEWLQYERYPNRWTFIQNQTQNMTEAQKEQAITDLSDLLGVEITTNLFAREAGQSVEYRPVITLGDLSTRASYDEVVRPQLESLHRRVMSDYSRTSPIPVSKDRCPIL